MGSGRARGDYNSVEIFLQYALVDQFLRILGTGKKGLFNEDDVSKRLSIPRHFVYVYDLSNV
jgi:hypothetical protein